MKKSVLLSLLLLPGCWGKDVETRVYDMAPQLSVRFELAVDDPHWVTFEAPEDWEFDALSRTCPILEDGASDQPMCAEIAQIAPDGTVIALIRGVIGAGLKFTPIDGSLALRFTNFSSQRISYSIRIEEGDA
ncbi:MAG: hypothetical protein AAGK71_04850 [Pseudomonadota bacterium]